METGGYAFAAASDEGYQSGMTLRDYIAGQAISGLATLVRFGNKGDAEIAAITAYMIADATLVEREKEEKK